MSTVAWSFPIPLVVFPAMAAFLTGEDPSLWTGTPGDIALTLPGSMHGYAWGNTERGWAWVRDELNRYDSGSMPGNVVNRTVSGNITVHGLTDGPYVVEIWNTYAGFKISSATYTSTSGSLTFASGTVDRDIAIKFFATSISPLPPPPPPIPPSGPPIPPPPAPPPGPIPTPSTSDIVITYDGTDITADVAIETANFTMMLGSNSGQAMVRVRDDDKNKTFVTGKELTLDINSQRVWGGYVMTAVRGNWFDVEDSTTISKVDSYWELTGSDYNILFQKRIAYNKADPTQQLKTYAAGTPDSSIILDIVNNYSDFDLDGVDTSGVVHVGTPNPDKPGVMGNPGDSLGTIFDQISRLTGAVYGITPDKALFNVDVNTATAPWVLTDMPGERDVGYRDLELLNNGSNLINDALVWGAGTGSGTGPGTGPVGGADFIRIQDDASIGVHGRWQYGEFSTALYTTNGLTQRASSFVYGSPQSNRGGKDDAISAILTIFVPGFIVGMKATTISNVYSYLDVLPIRQMDVTFVNSSQAQYKLYLSQSIDQPWSNYEFYFPPISIPPITITVPTLPVIGTPYTCITPTLFDDFNRTTTGDFGSTSLGAYPWNTYQSGGLTQFGCGFGSDNPTGAYAYNVTGVDGGFVAAFLSGVPGDPWTNGTRCQFMVKFTVFGELGAQLDWTIFSDDFNQELDWIANVRNDEFGSVEIVDNFGFAKIDKTDWVVGQEYILEGYADEYVGAGVRVYIDGGAIPDWTSFAYSSGQQTGMNSGTNFGFFMYEVNYPSSLFWRDLIFCCSPGAPTISQVGCSTIDSFTRTVSNGWGTDDAGQTWIIPDLAQEPAFSVDGSFGVVDQSDSLGSGDYHLYVPLPVSQIDGNPFDVVITYNKTITQQKNRSTGIVTAHPYFSDDVFYFSDTIDLTGNYAGVEVFNPDTTSTPYTWTASPFWNATGSPPNFTEQTGFVTGASVSNKLRLQMDNTGFRGKLWLASDPEPAGWTFNDDGIAANGNVFTPVYLFIEPRQSAGTVNHAPGQVLNIDEIDICMNQGIDLTGCTIFDDFNRDDPDPSFGVISSDGRPWTTVDLESETDAGVTSGSPSGGFLHGSNATGQAKALMSVVSASYDPWVTKDAIAFSVEVEWTGTFSGDSGGSFTLTLDDAALNRTSIFWTTTFGVGHLTVHDLTGQRQSAADISEITSDTTYLLEGYLSQTLGSAIRISPLSGPVSAWQLNPAVGIAPSQLMNPNIQLFLSMTTASMDTFGDDQTLYWRNLQFCDPPSIFSSGGCGDGQGTGGGSVPSNNPTSGDTCETTWTSTTAVKLSNGYVPNTTKIFVNGLLQRPALDYTESDPAAGRITLGSAPGTSATVYVCYTIDNSSGGGGPKTT